jgi:hypothetical protein
MEGSLYPPKAHGILVVYLQNNDSLYMENTLDKHSRPKCTIARLIKIAATAVDPPPSQTLTFEPRIGIAVAAGLTS